MWTYSVTLSAWVTGYCVTALFFCGRLMGVPVFSASRTAQQICTGSERVLPLPGGVWSIELVGDIQAFYKAHLSCDGP